MKVRDVIKMGSVVSVQVVLNEPRTLCSPVGTLGRVTGRETRQGKRYWEVSFPLPQADVDGGIFFYSAERPEMQVLYQPHELRKVRAQEPRPVTLVVARKALDGARYALYEVTRDERLLGVESLVELGPMPFADPPLEAFVPVERVGQTCAERGWHLLYKEGDLPYNYTAELTQRVGHGDAGETMPTTGTVLAGSAEEAFQLAVRVLLRDYPPGERYSGHEGVRVEAN
jgi:hypothetical protein